MRRGRRGRDAAAAAAAAIAREGARAGRDAVDTVARDARRGEPAIRAAGSAVAARGRAIARGRTHIARRVGAREKRRRRGTEQLRGLIRRVFGAARGGRTTTDRRAAAATVVRAAGIEPAARDDEQNDDEAPHADGLAPTVTPRAWLSRSAAGCRGARRHSWVQGAPSSARRLAKMSPTRACHSASARRARTSADRGSPSWRTTTLRLSSTRARSGLGGRAERVVRREASEPDVASPVQAADVAEGRREVVPRRRVDRAPGQSMLSRAAGASSCRASMAAVVGRLLTIIPTIARNPESF